MCGGWLCPTRVNSGAPGRKGGSPPYSLLGRTSYVRAKAEDKVFLMLRLELAGSHLATCHMPHGQAQAHRCKTGCEEPGPVFSSPHATTSAEHAPVPSVYTGSLHAQSQFYLLSSCGNRKHYPHFTEEAGQVESPAEADTADRMETQVGQGQGARVDGGGARCSRGPLGGWSSLQGPGGGA